MNLDVAIPARLQFVFIVGFHIIFPTISIGLAMFLARSHWSLSQSKWSCGF
jgi:cytochrome bd-type quinol oxidase subunit 1